MIAARLRRARRSVSDGRFRFAMRKTDDRLLRDLDPAVRDRHLTLGGLEGRRQLNVKVTSHPALYRSHAGRGSDRNNGVLDFVDIHVNSIVPWHDTHSTSPEDHHRRRRSSRCRARAGGKGFTEQPSKAGSPTWRSYRRHLTAEADPAGSPRAASASKRSIDEARDRTMFILMTTNRENEGDLVIRLRIATPTRSSSWRGHGRLHLSHYDRPRRTARNEPMTHTNRSRNETAFTV